jgi:hypothetical protein
MVTWRDRRERLALAGFLAAHSSLTRQACELDLRQHAGWCQQHHLRLFQARRADIENFARDLEARGRARANVTRRLCTIAGFCRYDVEEELLDHSPAAHVRRPRLDYESHATGLDRNELGALLVAVGLGPPPEQALISLLALNGLRVSEATGADVEGPGHRARAPDLGDHPQGRRSRHHPARAGAHRPRDRRVTGRGGEKRGVCRSFGVSATRGPGLHRLLDDAGRNGAASPSGEAAPDGMDRLHPAVEHACLQRIASSYRLPPTSNPGCTAPGQDRRRNTRPHPEARHGCPGSCLGSSSAACAAGGSGSSW